MAKALKIDKDTNDLVINGSGNFELVIDEDEEVQSTKLLLGTRKGEWFLNTLHGLDFDVIQQKIPDEEKIRTELIKTLSQDSRFQELTEFSIEFDRQKRELEVNFTALFDNGNTVSESVVTTI